MSRSRDLLERLFASAGVTLDGSEPWDIQVRDARFFDRVVALGSLGMGDSYVDGWWDCARIDELIRRVLSTDIEATVKPGLRTALDLLHAHIVNRQTPRRAPAVVAHYDAGNVFFERLLGPTMVYSCGYWPRAANLDEAQEHKLDLVCRKLHLQPGEPLLDLGSGWGGLAHHAASRHGARAAAVTLAKSQHEWALARFADNGARYLLADVRSDVVRELGRFPKISSVGMLEHIGRRNYRALMQRVHEQLEPDGLFLLHTIGTSVSTSETDPWIEKRIFPGSVLASPVDITRAVEGLFVVEDWHNFPLDYVPTLRAWNDNLEAYARSAGFPHDERFLRTWRYYLLAFAGCFAARRTIQLWQIVLAKQGRREGYTPVR